MKEGKTQKLSERLSAALFFVRQGSSVADIGTDHAYLPIYLAENGYSQRILASDINDGPCERARVNINEHGLSDIIKVRRCNGLSGIEDFAPDDIIIFGMGGELIISILNGCGYIKKKGIRLILQPMTSAAELYIWLCTNGFDIIGEEYITEASKHYRVICAQYSGIFLTPSVENAYIGKGSASDYFREYANNRLFVLETRIKGMKMSGRNTHYLDELREEIIKNQISKGAYGGNS